MRKKIITFFSCFTLALCILFTPQFTLASDDTNTGVITPTASYADYNEETNYYVYLDDWANLLSDEEEDKLLQVMKPITAYGNVGFVSISDNPEHNTERYVENYYQERFGYSSGTVLIIDMEERYIWIYSNGEIYDTITSSYAKTITDNVYSYASSEDYFSCASKAFEQINTLLEGRHIAQPMKYISNALLSIVLALFINYFLVMILSRSRKASVSQLLNGTFFKTEIRNPRQEFIKQTRRYSPQSSGSSGARSGGGLSRGGGMSRGGGGGHRF